MKCDSYRFTIVERKVADGRNGTECFFLEPAPLGLVGDGATSLVGFRSGEKCFISEEMVGQRRR
jgi:hypothetical protein